MLHLLSFACLILCSICLFLFFIFCVSVALFVLQKPLCEQILTGPAFNSCHSLLDVASFTSACVTDLCHCGNGMVKHADPFCLCNTVSEFSRQCVHAGGKPSNWRTKELCCEYTYQTILIKLPVSRRDCMPCLGLCPVRLKHTDPL